MKKTNSLFDRRNFLKTTATITTGLVGLSALNNSLMANDLPKEEGLFVIGPMDGYSPYIGTLVSMLNYNRQTIIDTVKNLTKEELDYLVDPAANTIGALILHLGAVDKYYQVNSFYGKQEFDEADNKIWDAAMNLGDKGRKSIKGQEIKYYLDMIGGVRQKTLEEFKKKDDKWLLAIDPEWSKKEPLNTFWKWFHVCEHESNHRGQITWLKKRLPGAKATDD
ncbi:MAG: DinB family protein [Ferruginibacter sp.]